MPRRHDEEKDGPAPRIEIDPHGSRGSTAPAVGDRVLASLKRRGKDTYQARIIRRLGSGPKKILGLYEEPNGHNGLGTVTPTDRKLRREFDVPARRQERRAAGRHRLDRGGRQRAVAPRQGDRTGRADERPAHDLPHLDRRQRHPRRLSRGSRQGSRGRQGGADGRPARPARSAAGHDRRRGCARLRRRGLRGTRSRPSGRLAPAGRDRRRRLVRAARQAARPSRLPPRHLGLFPRPRRADAARGPVEQLVLAAAAPGPAGAGRRDVDRRRRHAQEAPLPPRHDAFGGTAHLQPPAEGEGRRAGRRARAADGQRS